MLFRFLLCLANSLVGVVLLFFPKLGTEMRLPKDP